MSYPAFKKVFGNGSKLKALPEESLKVIHERLSCSLAELLSKEGACRYDGGFLFTVDPLDYGDVVKLVLGDEEGWVVARTVFGDLYLAMKGKVYLYQPSFHKFLEVAADVDSLFSGMLTQTSFSDKFLFRDLYAAAHAQLGDAGYEECYGFVPALPLGGPESVNNLRLVPMKEYLSMIIQMQQ